MCKVISLLGGFHIPQKVRRQKKLVVVFVTVVASLPFVKIVLTLAVATFCL